MQGEGLPQVTGPTARLIRSADGSVLKTQPVPPFNNAELPGNAASFKIYKPLHWMYICITNSGIDGGVAHEALAIPCCHCLTTISSA